MKWFTFWSIVPVLLLSNSLKASLANCSRYNCVSSSMTIFCVNVQTVWIVVID